jgi:xanthine dehydrogenase accessory factor
MSEWLPEIDEWRKSGRQVAIATVTKVEGSAPRPVGARLAVTADGEMAGSVSGGCVESAVVLEAQDVLKSGTPKLIRYGISDDMAWNVGLACGGTIEVFVEPVEGEA